MKLRAVLQDKEDIKWCIGEVFESDNDLIEKYHIKAGEGLKACINHTAKRLLECKDLLFYELDDEDGNFVGYFGLEPQDKFTVLSTFGILNEYRNKETSIAFWKTVLAMVGELVCGLYTRNTRAINWILKSGAKQTMKLEDVDEGESFQTFKICQSQQAF